MNDTSSDCPSEKLLHIFSAGALDAARTEAINRHLQNCAPCQRILRRAARTHDEHPANAETADQAGAFVLDDGSDPALPPRPLVAAPAIAPPPVPAQLIRPLPPPRRCRHFLPPSKLSCLRKSRRPPAAVPPQPLRWIGRQAPDRREINRLPLAGARFCQSLSGSCSLGWLAWA